MQLALTVFIGVLGVTIVLALFGYLIDKSAAHDERSEGR
jgi:hypothetical protein